MCRVSIDAAPLLASADLRAEEDLTLLATIWVIVVPASIV